MKKVLMALLVLGGLCGVAAADSVPTIQGPNQVKLPWTVTVYNNSATNLTSGAIVVWDTSTTNFTASGYPYVTTTTTVDDLWTAGVVYDNTCVAGNTCEIVVYGPVSVLCRDLNDAVGINTTVGTSAIATQCGDYTPAANKRSLGTAMQAGSGTDSAPIMIWVDTLGAPAEQ